MRVACSRGLGLGKFTVAERGVCLSKTTLGSPRIQPWHIYGERGREHQGEDAAYLARRHRRSPGERAPHRRVRLSARLGSRTSLNNVIGSQSKRLWDSKTERLRSLQVDHDVELRDLLD